MKKSNDIKGSINSIETLGLVDGPGIRTIIFLNGCSLRCKYCHNPEMWCFQQKNTTPEEIVQKVIRNKPYFKNGGGVTFSGGEPLLQYDFLLETCKQLKKENIHIALDTAGIGLGSYDELLQYVDLVLLDIKHITKEGYIDITQQDRLKDFFVFIESLNKSNTDVWIRQVIIPGVNDTKEYVQNLAKFLKENLKNVKRVDFLPYHKLGGEKYDKLLIENPYKNQPEMSKEECEHLYQIFLQEQ